MQETDAVSCLLCLEPDEYGSMIRVVVPPNRIPPSSEKVVCRRCVGALIQAAGETDEGVPGEAEVLTDNQADLATEAEKPEAKTDD